MEQWIEKECQSSNFGDKRLVTRFSKILEDFSKSPMESIPPVVADGVKPLELIVLSTTLK